MTATSPEAGVSPEAPFLASPEASSEAPSHPSPELPLAIEDYALVGDCVSGALVGRNGSIDWLCWPRFDSDACFAALLGTSEHGRWKIAPAGAVTAVSRRYRGETLVLETLFETATGSVALIDFMPIGAERTGSSLVRIVEGRSGRVEMTMQLTLRFDYGQSVPWVTRLPDGTGLSAIAGPNAVVLRTTAPIDSDGLATVASFAIEAGAQMSFSLAHGPSHLPLPKPVEAGAALARAERWWQRWSKRCRYRGRWRDPVMRSLITLKALTFAPTGGIVAALTTSLPEQPGGPRNWDYRYCWLRDATLTLMAMMAAGYEEEAAAWRAWLLRAVAGSPDQIQIMYGIAGERRLAEWTVDGLPGYLGAAPVRIGNAASDQIQLDVFGEVMDALHQARHDDLAPAPSGWALQLALVEHLEAIVGEPDEGIWEVRGGRRHFTYSKVMAWVAFDRTLRDAERFGLDSAPLERWRALRDRLHAEICERGFDAGRNTFVQSYGGEELDASLLLIPVVGFLPADDPRVAGTVAAIEKELDAGGLVLRYRTAEGVDGLPPGEGAFLACSFWLADVYCLQHRRAEAEALFERLLGLANDVGLLAEEYDPRRRRQLGNFPQAFSHLALVNTALALDGRHGPTHKRGRRKS
jgi:GH15 family glucan-1,4-alpha-glucosidase